MNLKSSIGFSLSKFGAPLEPGNGIVFEELLPERVGSTVVELSPSVGIFIIFLRAAEFGFILSGTLTVILGFAGRGWGNVSVLNENLCATVLTGGLGLCLVGGGNPDDSPAFLEFAVSLTFAGAVVNGYELALNCFCLLNSFGDVEFEPVFK